MPLDSRARLVLAAVARFATAVAVGSWSGACGSDAPTEVSPPYQRGSHITDEQLCMFRLGVTTIAQVRATLGPPYNEGSGCFWHVFSSFLQYDFTRTVDGKEVSESTSFDFDPGGILVRVDRLRVRSDDTTPLPACLGVEADGGVPPAGLYPCPPADAGDGLEVGDAK